MADQPAAPAGRKKFNASNPGAKEYLIVGGVALLVGLAYLWWKNKQSPASSSTQPATGPAGAVDANGNPVPGIQINQGTGTDAGGLQSQLQDQQSSPTTTATGGGSSGAGGAGGAGGVGGGAGGAGAGAVPVPATQQNLALMNAAPLTVAASAPAPALAQQSFVPSVGNKAPAPARTSPGGIAGLLGTSNVPSVGNKAPAPARTSPGGIASLIRAPAPAPAPRPVVSNPITRRAVPGGQ